MGESVNQTLRWGPSGTGCFYCGIWLIDLGVVTLRFMQTFTSVLKHVWKTSVESWACSEERFCYSNMSVSFHFSVKQVNFTTVNRLRFYIILGRGLFKNHWICLSVPPNENIRQTKDGIFGWSSWVVWKTTSPAVGQRVKMAPSTVWPLSPPPWLQVCGRPGRASKAASPWCAETQPESGWLEVESMSSSA